MQKRFSILISAMTLAISAAAQVGAIDPFGSRSGQALNRPGNEHDHEQEHEKQKYTCPMHPEVVTESSRQLSEMRDETRADAQEETPNVQRPTLQRPR